MQVLHWVAVALGGATGALLRASVYEFFALGRYVHLHYLPTFAVNVVGSAIIGGCFYLFTEKGVLPAEWRVFVMTGLLGAFTTFSTFSLDVIKLFQSDRVLEAAGFAVASVLVCTLATWLTYTGLKAIF